MQHSLDTVREVVQAFPLEGQLVSVEAHERGHIHDTFVSTWNTGGSVRRYLHQYLNETVFTDIDALMHNIARVTDHLRAKTDAPDGLEVLSLVRTRDGAAYLRHESGAWRTYTYVENTVSHDLCDGPDQAFEAARAFGLFQQQLIDLPVDELAEPLPRFFSSPFRYEQFENAVLGNAANRLREVESEMEFVRARVDMVNVIEDSLELGRFPRRVIHGDTKLNNVLFDQSTGRARCVVDLDTTMSGYSLFDFGDLVRFTAATAKEDETDLSLAGMDMELYRAIVDGYLSTAGDFLTPLEVTLLPFAARLVTFTCGIRFLADYLNGDAYFKVHRPTHNLDRARVQFRMVKSMEDQERQMTEAIERPVG